MSAGAMQNPGNRFTRLTKWGEIMGNIFAQKDLASYLDFTTFDLTNTIELGAAIVLSLWKIGRPAGVLADERVRVKKQVVVKADYPHAELS
ncbi:hypothetical protein, partial [Cecembia lonarensis]|uniref:hypothetical protein n=1 Tax=Cecembia lonarensis TaxID=645110 RepID=UPI00058BEFE5